MSSSDLTQGSVKDHLTRMTLPMMWGIMAIMSMNIVDTFFVGQLGKEPLAAMGFTIPILSILLAIAFGVGIGVSSVIAREIGAKEWSLVRSYCTQGILMAVAIALIFAILGLNYTDFIFSTLGAPAELMPLIHDYMDIWFLGSFVVVIPMVGNSAIRAAGNTKVPSIVMISVAIANIVLDPILIFGLFGFPRMELAGAALATVISYSAALIIGLYFLVIKLKFVTYKALYTRIGESWWAISRIAIPSVGTNLIAPLSVAIATWFVSFYGPEAVAGLGVATRIESFALVVVMALSSITGPFVGQNWGAQKFNRVREGVKGSFYFVLFWGLLVTLTMWVAAEPLARLFNANEEIVYSATRYLYWVPLSYGALGIIMISSSAANGTGNPKPALMMSLTRLLLVYVPLAWWLPQLFGLSGIYLASTIANLLVACAAILWVKSQFSRT